MKAPVFMEEIISLLVLSRTGWQYLSFSMNSTFTLLPFFSLVTIMRL